MEPWAALVVAVRLMAEPKQEERSFPPFTDIGLGFVKTTSTVVSNPEFKSRIKIE